MRYSPFDRGASPVGVRTIAFPKDRDADALRQAEVWYPAAEAYRGHDLNDVGQDWFTVMVGVDLRQAAVRNAPPAAGDRLPLIVYCHGGYGHRRDNAALATHLASHGYVVVAPQFFDSIADMGLEGGKAAIKDEPIDRSAAARPHQASWTITQILAGADAAIARMVDPSRIGSFGGSLGGYTTLELNAVDTRVSATVALAPACGYRSPLPVMRRIKQLMHPGAWREVPTTLITGDEDVLVNVEDVRDLFNVMTGPKRLVVVHEAGHIHMFDNAEFGHEMYRREYTSGSFPDPEIDAIAIGRGMRPFAEMLSERQSAETVRAITLAHMDAHLKGRGDARALLDSDLEALLRSRGVTLDVSAGVGV